MRNRLFWIFSALTGLFLLGVTIPACGKLFVYGVYYPVAGTAEIIGDSIEDGVARNKAIAEEKWRGKLLRQAEKDPGLWKEISAKLISRDMATYICKRDFEKNCYGLIYTPQKINLNSFVNQIKKLDFMYGYSSILGFLATSENVDKGKAGKLGMRPLPFGEESSDGEFMVRAALLRRALTDYSISPRQSRRAMPAPSQDQTQMADRLLELDLAVMKDYDRHFGGGRWEYEIYLGMDYELRAYLGPENEFRLFADKAMGHYLNAIQNHGLVNHEGWKTTIAALLHYDRLAVSETQRLAAVRLFIEKTPNVYIKKNHSPFPRIDVISDSDKYWNYDDAKYVDIPRFVRLETILDYSSILQPSIWDFVKIQWRQDWGRQLDEMLQQNGANKEISRLLLKAYPMMEEED